MGSKFFLLSWLVAALVGCASSPEAPSSVLEPAPVEPTAEETVVPAEPVAPKPHERLVAQLKRLGYEGLGLEFEDPKVLDLLEKVFTAPETHGRDIKLVYTGMRMQYDKAQKSITIGGTKDLKVILAFFKKHVPKGPPPPPIPPTESSQAPVLPNQ